MTEKSIEDPGSSLSDPVESNERLDLCQLKSNGRRGHYHQDAIGDNEHRGLPNSDEPIEVEHPENLPKTPSAEDSHRQKEADELMVKLKAETGYSSYADYVEAYSRKRQFLMRLLIHVNTPHHSHYMPRFTILDVSKEDNSGSQVVLRCCSKYAASIVTTLRQPPANVAVQILLWKDYEYCCPTVLSILGLGLKIDPRFFEALNSRRRRHLDPKHVTITGAFANVLRHYNPELLDAAPIVLIARMKWVSEIAEDAEEEIGDVLPFQYPAVETDRFQTDRGDPPLNGQMFGPIHNEYPNYTRLLKWCLEKDEEPAVGVTNLTLQPLVPLFYLEILRIRRCCVHLRQGYYALYDNDMKDRDKKDMLGAGKEEFISYLPEKRLRLRALVEDSEDVLDQFLRYVDSQQSSDLLLTRLWRKAEKDIRNTHREAARLEAQIRDSLQLQVGEWALQESKESIELSNRQIEEGKRG